MRDKKPHEGKYGPGQNSEELTASKCLPGHPGWVSTGLVVISGLEGCPEYGPLFPLSRPIFAVQPKVAMCTAALSVPHTPRFRALALFGRRLSERGDGLGMPASENLHIAH